MNKKQFQASIKGKTVLADFSAPWCGPCRMMAPIMATVAAQYQGKATVVQINIDAEKGLAMDFMVQSIPTFILFKDGKELKRLVGMQSKSVIEESLNRLLS